MVEDIGNPTRDINGDLIENTLIPQPITAPVTAKNHNNSIETKDWWTTTTQPSYSQPNYTSTPGPIRNMSLPLTFGMANNTFLNAKPSGIGTFNKKKKKKSELIKKMKKTPKPKFWGI
jgi:hypothetical protein